MKTPSSSTRFMKTSLATIGAIITSLPSSSHAEIYMLGDLGGLSNDCRSGAFHKVTFDEKNDDNPLPWTTYNDLLDIGKVTFGERFDGQRLNTRVKNYDQLTGHPTNPLTLRQGRIGRNLAVYYNHLNDSSALNGLGPDYSTATGAISAVIDDDISYVDLDLLAGEPSFEGSLWVKGYRRDGSLINEFRVESEDFLWEGETGTLRLGMENIAGFSIYGLLTGRIYLDNVNICDSRPSGTN
mmetsp:Transcript_53166/g.64053  ORF Transcript_53166/g.64053 Transcript_53166/m.64053 type:complete len:240 (-) Transcript_53166:59-778(-)|eukprot:CAMPEP_0172497920 /NCGR_PEP_ID=MMETSP1066-20121228/106929_1 /TAXON_ID=671091 /ORGANISM="Coscinodiscus wailesii, Strain CCMP2513" /LENGTH=239 /DNA_ID=CAMNT_0013270955 /DNA_START=29 /DNA_END=748 /DNA_ORIENTATION=+